MKRVLSVSVLLASGFLQPAEGEEIVVRVPEGFAVEKVAGSPDVRFPMFGAFDEAGRLYVAEASGNDLYAELRAQTRNCRVSVLEDTTGDGVYDSARVFADRLVYPMGLVWREGKLYVADPPDLAVYEDTTGDGAADRRRVILTGFGHQDNGSLHGLIFGPDGWLYMTMGWPDGYRLERADGTILEGTSGALIRSRPDGSDVEVVSRGFDNLVEVAFTLRGDVIGTDNWFQEPRGGIRDALVYLVEGGLYPRQADRGTAQPVTGEPLPAMTLLPAVAISGIDINYGEGFPAEMRGDLFTAWFNSRKVTRHRLIPDGATFRTEDHEFAASEHPDFHPSDVLMAADGSLLVIDTGGWYVEHCPTGKIRKSMAPGGIYRVRYEGAAPVNDPWGKEIGWDSLHPVELAALLEDKRPVARDRAQRKLGRLGEEAVEAIESLLSEAGETGPKQQALWALANMDGAGSLAALRRALNDSEPDLVMTAARGLRVRADRGAGEALAALLEHPVEPVRLAAAQALATCGGRESLPALWKALRRDEMDRFIEHAVIHALHLIADEPELARALEDPHPRAQMAALRLLDQPPRPGVKMEAVLDRLSSPDASLRRAALQLLKKHRHWESEAAEFARVQLRNRSLSEQEEEGLSGLILAFHQSRGMRELIGKWLNDPREEAERRQLFLLGLLQQTSVRPFPEAWEKGLDRFLRGTDAVLRAEAVRVAAVLQLSRFDEQLGRLAEEAGVPIETRLESLRAVVARRAEVTPEQFNFLLSQAGTEVNPVLRMAAAQVLGRARLTREQAESLAGVVQGSPMISPSVLLPALLAPEGEIAPAVFDYLSGAVQTGWRPDDRELGKIIERAPAHSEVQRTIAAWRRAREGDAARLARFEPLLIGGNEERGRAVFFGDRAACAMCHRVGSEGSHSGPDLTMIGAIRSGRDLLEAIILPSSTFAQGYETYSVWLEDGRELTGMIVEQSPESLLLRDSAGGESRIQREAVRELTRHNVSIMPEGLESALSEEEFRDLLAFLRELK